MFFLTLRGLWDGTKLNKASVSCPLKPGRCDARVYCAYLCVCCGTLQCSAASPPSLLSFTKGGAVHYICSSSFFSPGQYIMRFQVRNDKELIFLSFICFYLVPVKEHMHTVITTVFFLSLALRSPPWTWDFV